MTLARSVLATVHCNARDIKVGGPCFSLVSSFFSETENTKFVSEEIATTPFPSHRKAATDSEACQAAPSCAQSPPRSTSRDCRPYIVLSRAAQHRRLGPPGEIVSLPACTQRAVRRGAAFVLCCPQRNIDLRSRTVWAYGQATSESTAIDIISAPSASPPAPQLYH